MTDYPQLFISAAGDPPINPGLSRGMSPHMGVGQGTTPACVRQGLCPRGSMT